MTCIRRITDENELVRLFPLFISEGVEVGLDVTKLNPDKLWYNLRHDMEHAAIFVVERDNIIAGAMVMVLVDSYWCDELSLANRLYYVLPKFRKSMFGIQLLKAGRDYAKNKGMAFNINVETLTDVERKDKLFARYGFKKMGGYYKLEETICQVQ